MHYEREYEYKVLLGDDCMVDSKSGGGYRKLERGNADRQAFAPTRSTRSHRVKTKNTRKIYSLYLDYISCTAKGKKISRRASTASKGK